MLLERVVCVCAWVRVGRWVGFENDKHKKQQQKKPKKQTNKQKKAKSKKKKPKKTTKKKKKQIKQFWDKTIMVQFWGLSWWEG